MLLSAAHLGSALIFRSLLQILFKSLQALRTLSIPLWLLLIFVYFLTTSSCSYLVCVWCSWGKKTATSRKECAVIPHSRSIVFHKWVTLTILRRCFIFTQESGCYICVTGVLISVFNTPVYIYIGLFILNLTLGLFYFPILGIDSVLLDFSFLFCLVTSKICILCGLVSCGFYVLVHSSGVCCIQMIPAFLCVHFWRRWCSGAEVMALTSWSSIKTPHVMAVIWSPMVRTSCCSYVLDLTVQACKFWLSVLRQHESSGKNFLL